MRPIDEKDRQILDLLRADARLPLKTLAAKVGLARSTLRDRLSKLEADRIIRGYRAEIVESGPAVSVYLFVRLKTTPAPSFIAMLRRIAEVKSCTSLTGPCRPKGPWPSRPSSAVAWPRAKPPAPATRATPTAPPASSSRPRVLPGCRGGGAGA